MSDLKLTLACWDYDRTRPLIDGHVKAKGIDLDIKVLRPRQMFPRMLEDKEFHASENCRWRHSCRSSARGLSVCWHSRSRLEVFPPFLHLCAQGCRHPHAAGFARQTRWHDAIFIDRRHLHARHAAGRIRPARKGHALVHGRTDGPHRTPAHSPRPACGCEARIPAGWGNA